MNLSKASYPTFMVLGYGGSHGKSCTETQKKDRTESFDDLFPCRNHGEKCSKFIHINNWINVFSRHHQTMYQSFIKAIKKASLSKRSRAFWKEILVQRVDLK